MGISDTIFIYKEKAFKNYTQHYNISFKNQFLAINIKNT